MTHLKDGNQSSITAEFPILAEGLQVAYKSALIPPKIVVSSGVNLW